MTHSCKLGDPVSINYITFRFIADKLTNGDEKSRKILTIHEQKTVLGLHFAFEFAVRGIMFEHVHHVLQVDERIIDCANLHQMFRLDMGSFLLHNRQA